MKIKNEHRWIALAAIGSFLLHTLFLITLTSSNKGEGDKEGENRGEGFVDFTPTIIEKLPGSGDSGSCEDWYGGIGITGWDRVERVYSGYPADRAGIKSGDLIISDFNAIKGKPGTPVTVTVLRGNDQLTFSMVREKICTAGERP